MVVGLVMCLFPFGGGAWAFVHCTCGEWDDAVVLVGSVCRPPVCVPVLWVGLLEEPHDMSANPPAAVVEQHNSRRVALNGDTGAA